MLNSRGNICGINLGDASFFTNKQSILASLIYPALAIKLKLTVQIAEKFTFNIHQPLFNLIKSGGIRTDGSENMSRIFVEDDQFRIDPLIHRDDADHVFNDFHGYQNSQPANPNPDGLVSILEHKKSEPANKANSRAKVNPRPWDSI